jgi:spore germination protein GerM
MAQKRSGTKKKKGKTKSRGKRSSGTIPWRNLSIALCIIVCGILYLLIRYDLLKTTKEKSPPAVTAKRNLTLNLYYADPYSEKLSPEKRTIQKGKTLKQTIETVIEEFIKGPKGDLVNTIPSGTVLKDVGIDSEGIVSVDFNSHLSQAHPGGSSAEILTVYAIVNSILLNFDEVTKVRILIEGKSVDTLAGHINCSEPFVADRSFLK